MPHQKTSNSAPTKSTALPAPTAEQEQSLSRFQQLLRIPTISRHDVSDTDWQPFEDFIALLPELYPNLHRVLKLEIVNDYTLLYHWSGKSSEKPTVLMAHYDVVSATDDDWVHPPFAASRLEHEGEEVLWSRGAIDDKGAVVAILEAVEASVLAGVQPEHDLYLSFGHDEETHGSGAKAVVDLLQSRGIAPALVLDEGGAVVEGVFPGLTKPAALIGIAEKGILNLKLEVREAGGHASTPPKLSATAQLARAIVRINKKPFPASLSAPSRAMMRTLGAHTKQPYRFLFTQQWLTKPLLVALFKALSNETRAIVRTTTATTQLSGSQAHNALPEIASANVNIRIQTGESAAFATDYVRKAVNDPAVTITAHNAAEPSPVSPSEGEAWQRLEAAVLHSYPDVVVSPYVQLGASDSRWFTAISENVYRFTPFELSLAERGTLHAVNERIKIRTWLQGIEFFRTLIESS